VSCEKNINMCGGSTPILFCIIYLPIMLLIDDI
jgi:hypothetical protein